MGKSLTQIAIVIIAGVLSSPSFAIYTEPQDTIDQFLENKLASYQQRFHYTNPDSLSEKLVELKLYASNNKKWQWLLFLHSAEAQSFIHHQRYSRAKAIFTEADSIWEAYQPEYEHLDPHREALKDILFAKASFYYELGQYNRAINYFDQVLALNEHDRTLATDYLFSIHSYLGAAYVKLLLFDKARLHYDHAMGQIDGVYEDYRDYYRALNHFYLGDINRHLAVFNKADEMLDTALTQYRTGLEILERDRENSTYRNGFITAHREMANIFKLKSQTDSAIYHLEKALTFQERQDVLYVKNLLEFGDVYRAGGRDSQASTYYDKALHQAELIADTDHYIKGEIYHGFAELAFRQEEYDSALGYVERALNFFKPNYSSTTHFTKTLKAVALKGNILKSIYRNKHIDSVMSETVATFLYGLKMVDRVEKQLPYTDYKQFFKAHLQGFYESALDACYMATVNYPQNEHYENVFFTFLESNKNSLLREGIQNVRALHYSQVPDSLIERESFIKSQIGKLQQRITDKNSRKDNLQDKDKLFRLNESLDKLIAYLERAYPDYYELKYSAATVELSDVQAYLSKDQSLIEYFWGDNAVYAISITKGSIQPNKFLLTDQHLEKMMRLRKAVSSPGKISVGKFSQLSNDVYSTFVTPVLPANEAVDKLIIIADGQLAYIPFESFSTKIIADGTFADIPYLLGKYTIRNLLSASFLKETSIEYINKNIYLGYAPSYANMNASLKHNQEEVKKVSGLIGGKVFTGSEASKSAFLRTAGNSRLLHLATHTNLNEADPSLSGFLFYGEEGVDNVLHLYEIYNLQLPAALTVLSGCETGSGRYARGEGIISLGRAFRYAGSSSIIMSLWKVNDNTTTAIMENLFFNLDAGQPKDKALRQAKLSFLSDPKNKYFSHPYYWSSFILLGDNRVIEKETAYIYIIGTVVLVITILLVFAYRKTSFKKKGLNW